MLLRDCAELLGNRVSDYARIRRTEVRPICNLRAISALLMSARCSARTSSAWSPAVMGRPSLLPFRRAMAALLAVFAEFEREILRERVRAGLAHAQQNGKGLGRPITAGLHADEVRALHRADISKAEIARKLQIGRTSVRRILA